MFRNLKYLLLRYLMYNVCHNSKCEDCACKCEVTLRLNDEDFKAPGCEQQSTLYQARKVWRIKK